MHCSGCFQDAILIVSGENNFNGFRSLKLAFVLVVRNSSLYTGSAKPKCAFSF